jgi:hypothetical protein
MPWPNYSGFCFDDTCRGTDALNAWSFWRSCHGACRRRSQRFVRVAVPLFVGPFVVIPNLSTIGERFDRRRGSLALLKGVAGEGAAGIPSTASRRKQQAYARRMCGTVRRRSRARTDCDVSLAGSAGAPIQTVCDSRRSVRYHYNHPSERVPEKPPRSGDRQVFNR